MSVTVTTMQSRSEKISQTLQSELGELFLDRADTDQMSSKDLLADVKEEHINRKLMVFMLQ
jgi:hypothetical protein